jgi:hypothetical protein
MHYFSNIFYFWNVLDSSSAHHQEFSTVHTAMVYVIHVCLQFHPDPARKLSAKCMTYIIAVYTVENS